MELLCTEDQIYELIMQLDNQKSTGTDNVSARMLKATTVSILLPNYSTCLSEQEDFPPAGKQQG